MPLMHCQIDCSRRFFTRSTCTVLSHTHVVASDEALSTDVSTRMEIFLLCRGQAVTVDLSNHVSTVVSADVFTSNGVIMHVMHQVLVPSSVDVGVRASLQTCHTALSSLPSSSLPDIPTTYRNQCWYFYNSSDGIILSAATDLVGAAVSEPTQWTVYGIFAPNDDACTAFPHGLVSFVFVKRKECTNSL
mmetsp:Transcript_47131/g.50925  ORF Transcript_47131/g.50925 Transcript_47131/m.50925 type:complete len:189 (-) Transcript_47131:264-830(-)